MNKSFLCENSIKTILAICVFATCWATLTPAMAQNGPQRPDRDAIRERIEERMAAMDKHLTVEQVRDIAEGRIAMMGDTNLKVGDVTAKDEDTVSVNIVTKDGSLVQTMDISTRTGLRDRGEGEFAKAMTKRSDRKGLFARRSGDRERGFRRGRGDFDQLALSMGPRGRDRNLELTVDEARTLAEARLIMAGNDRLKVGKVEAGNDDTIIVEIVTVDDSLVIRREIDRSTGRMKRTRI